jgi:glutamyl-tRNA reductase
MVVGEPQILGQLKDHYAEASSAGTSGAVLHRAFHRSFKVAKRVRNETGIAAKAVSVASVGSISPATSSRPSPTRRRC